MRTILLGFLLAMIGSMPPIGPASALVLRRGLGGKFREAIAIGAGGALAEGTYCLLAASSVGALMRRTPGLDFAARVLAAILLLALGVHFLRVPVEHAESSVRERPGRAFVVGWVAGVVNPGALLAWSAAIAILCATGRFDLDGVGRVGFALAVAAGVFSWFAIEVLAMRSFDRRIALRGTRRIVRATGALLACASAITAWSLLRLR